MTKSARTTACAALALAASAAAAACGGRTAPILAGDRLAVGTWGGENAGVIVGDTVAHVHIGCTFGDLPGPVPLDAAGRFTVQGSYVLRAYPIAVGPSLPARFTGVVDGGTLTLRVTVTDTVQHRVVELGPASVTYGREPRMGPCPICRSLADRRARVGAMRTR